MTTDGTATEQDPAGKAASSAGKQETSTEKSPTFTPEQQKVIDGLMEKAKSDALSTAGRTDKDLGEREKAVKAREGVARQAETDARDRRFREQRDAVKDDPAALQKLTTAHDAEVAIEETRVEKGQAAEATKTANEAIVKANAARIAAENGVSAKDLLEMTNGSEETMERLAKVLPKMGQESADTTPEAKRQAVPDSGVTTGSGTGKVTRGEAATFTTEGKTFAEIQEMKERLLNSPTT